MSREALLTSVSVSDGVLWPMSGIALEHLNGTPKSLLSSALVSDDLRSILNRLLLTAQSLREQLHLLDQERRNAPSQT